MDSLLNTKKRKKWKTRKHLNEMRKRSRNKSVHENKNVDSVIKTSPAIASNDRECNIGSITYHRLTLPMFPKVVRSETITRPVLSHIRHEASLNFNNILRNQKQVNCGICIKGIEQTKGRSEITGHTDHNSIICENEYTDHVSSCKSESENMNTCGDDISGSISLFSPTSPQIVNSDITETPLNNVSLCTYPSSVSSQHIRRYHKYEEFMNDISTYLKEITPSLITDVTRKHRKLLENVYTENCHHEYEENILKDIKNNALTEKSHSAISHKETIIQNPMAYIKLGNAWWQSHSTSNLSASSSVGNNSPNSFCHLNSPLAPDSLPDLTIVDNTPEYVYYPHRLNQ